MSNKLTADKRAEVVVKKRSQKEAKASQKPCTMDMFDINGLDKLELESVENRARIIEHYGKEDSDAIFFFSSSAGKDSMDGFLELQKQVHKSRIVLIHAHLGAVEHDGVIEHIEANNPNNIPLFVVKNEHRDFIDMVLRRGWFPSPKHRNCTSDLKTAPIEKFIRNYMKEKGATVGFNVMGLRSQESVPRSKKAPLIRHPKLSLDSGKRTIYNYLPVFHHTTEEVYDNIYAAGQKPHPAYGERGELNTRLSCVFCIMGSVNDLQHGARNYPELYALYVALEMVIGRTMFVKRVKNESVQVSITEKTGIPVDPDLLKVTLEQVKWRRAALLKKEEEEQEKKLKAKKIKKEQVIAIKRVNPDNLDLFAQNM